MQAVSEFMEQGPRIVGRQQRRLATGAFGEVADIDDERGDFAVELLLVAQRGHPGARALRGPRKVIAIEQRLVLAVGIPDLPDPDVRVPERMSFRSEKVIPNSRVAQSKAASIMWSRTR